VGRRLKGFTGGAGEIIANDLPSGAAVVTIKKTDKGFSTSSCGTWEK